ncbi:unnamed protein product [Peniophora sp. CBMAI 1063]|nr:unnamed protein product [Peniophora sp. CBMAI 1063]
MSDSQVEVGATDSLGGCGHASRRTNTCACTPFNTRLPPEIQQMIFSWVAVLDPPSIPGDAKGSLGFVLISHVCRHWRTTLLSMRHVWADSMGLLPEATIEMVRRAGSHPLTVTLRSDLSPFDEGMGLFCHRRSTRALHCALSEPSPSRAREYEDVFCDEVHPWPILETLKIEVSDRIIGMDKDSLMPSLRFLTMKNIFNHFTAPSLQSLSIEFQEWTKGSFALQAFKFFDMVRACRSTLQDLELTHCFAPDAMPLIPTPIELPELRSLYLGGCSHQLLDAARNCFTYPSACDISFRPLYDYTTTNPFQPDESLHLVLRAFSDEVIACTGSYGFEFHALPGEASHISVRALSPEALAGTGDLFVTPPDLGSRKVYFDSDRMRIFHDDIFDALSYALIPASTKKANLNLSALRDVRVLSIVQAGTEPATGAMRKVLLEMPELRVLHLRGGTADMMRCICPVISHGRLSVPNLQLLRVSADRPYAPPLDLWQFNRCLRRRAEYHQAGGRPSPLPCLIVDRNVEFDEGLEAQKAGVERLQEMNCVKKVYWRLI